MKNCALNSPNIRFAGQITGVEGYVESAAIGLLAGRMAAHDRLRLVMDAATSGYRAWGAFTHITGAMADSFQPMNVNFGLFPELPSQRGGAHGRDRKSSYAKRAGSSWQWARTA